MVLRCISLAVLSALAVHPAFGHGRIASSVEVAIGRENAEVTLKLALIDVLQIADLRQSDYLDMAPAEREAWAHAETEALSQRFWIFADDDATPRAWSSMKTEGPVAPDPRNRDIEQHHIEIAFRCTFEAPPERLVFLQDFGTVDGDHPVFAQMLIYQEDELMLLPTELGPGFPVTVFPDWSGESVSLAHRTDLSSALCGWRCRAPSARLDLTKGRAMWTLFFPLRALLPELDGLELEAEADSADVYRRLHNLFSQHFTLRAGGEPVQPLPLTVRIHPLSPGRYLHHDDFTFERGEEGLVEAIFSATISEDGPIEAKTSLFNDDVPHLFNETVRDGQIIGWTRLHPESNTLSISQ